MASSAPPPAPAPQTNAVPKPLLPKPPGYRDPNAPAPPLRLPPRKQPLPPAHPRKRRQPPPRRRCCGCGCCCCCTILLVLAFVAALGAAACYLYYEPRLPTFHLQSVKVDRLRVAARPEGTFVDAGAMAAVRVRNPSGKVGMGYGEWEVAVRLEGGEVGTGRVGGFEQGRRNSTVLRVGVVGRGVMVDDRVGVRLRKRYKNKEASVEVAVRTSVGVEGSGVRVPVKVVCGGVRLKDLQGGGGGKAEGSVMLPPRCSIYVLRWIKLR